MNRIRSIFLPLEKSDVLLFIGGAFLFFGTFQIYPPAAYILIGLILVVLSASTAREKASKKAAE